MTRVYMHSTREAWLQAAVDLYRPVFADAIGDDLPTVRVAIGWTSKGIRSRAIGQCWYPESVSDGTPELFIVPTIDDPARVLDVLAHELVHVSAGPDAKHGAEFKARATAIGLTGKMTATTAGPDLAATIAAMLTDLGPYPGATIINGPSTARPTQGTRMLKLECADCGYTVRTTRKWLDVGAPTCPCGCAMAEV